MIRATTATNYYGWNLPNSVSQGGSSHTGGGGGGDLGIGTGPPRMEPSMTCMSVVMDRSILAFACYDEERNEILLETCRIPSSSGGGGGDSRSSSSPSSSKNKELEDIVERFKQFASPNMVLISNKIVNDASLLNTLTTAPTIAVVAPSSDGDEKENDGGGGTTTGGDPNATLPTVTQQSNNGVNPQQQQTRRSIPYRVLKSGNFDYHKCKALILQHLKVTTLLRPNAQPPVGFYDPNRNHRQFLHPPGRQQHRYFKPSSYHSLAAVVDFDCKAQVQALGALLSYLQTTVFQLEDHQAITVNRILFANLRLFMHIDSETFSALGIFSTEYHPLLAKGSPGTSKEGWSLFSLLDRTRSKGGRQLLREWMLRPLVDPGAISARQDVVEVFMHANTEHVVGILINLMSNVGPMDQILTRMQKCSTKPMDFLVLSKSISASISIYRALQNEMLPLLVGDQGQPLIVGSQSHQVLTNICQKFNVTTLEKLLGDIQEVVDEERTNALKTSVVVRTGFNEKLDQAKVAYDNLPGTLRQHGADLNRRYPELSPITVVFLPQVGFLFGLRKTLVLGNMTVPSDFKLIFHQGEESFFKTDDMTDLDTSIGDLDGYIKDTEGMLISELEDNILDSEFALRQAAKAISELDCIVAFADCAVDSNYTRPIITSQQESNLIHIKEGRHPLQEIITEKEFVCNDTKLDENQRLAVVTGPNYSGKSCYLRQVGLLVYMAHIGSFIPCTAAQISVTDKLFARICTVETCAVPQSSFQLDLTQMASILLKCTSRSLVLVDEFGKGTSPSSGIALLGSALKKLSNIRCKGVCTTHFLELFSAKVIEDGVDGIKAQRMSLYLPEDGDDNATSLFKLEDGIASTSAGIICAKRAGVNRGVIARAKDIIQSIRHGKEIAPLEGLVPPVVELTEAERDLLQHFFSVESWEDATEDQLRTFVQKVSRLDP